jgi:DNA-binding SARP family transcriptional activator
VQFRILGPLEVLDGDRLVDLGRPKQRALLAVLLAHADAVVGVDRLIEDLWQDEPPGRATASLQAYVSNLRRALEPSRPPRAPARVLVSQPPGYRLVVSPDDLDAARFQARAGRGHALLEAGRPADAARELGAALGLWRGPALAEVADQPFAQGECHRLEQLRLVALEDRLTADLAVGRHAAATAELQELVRAHPFRERLTGLLMLALYRSGRQAEALAAYQVSSEQLRDELGIDPSRWLAQLRTDILRQAVALDWTPPPDPGPPPTTAPPPGRAPTGRLGPPRGGTLVGRDQQLILLDEAVTAAAAGHGGVVLLAGEPGIGKTRLAEEAARRASDAGVTVAWGRCYDGDGAPAFWPWLQVTRALIADIPAEGRPAPLGPWAADLAPLLPELTSLVPGAPVASPVVELEAARFRVYQAVLHLLRRSAEASPLLVIVDDLHWADVASLRLLVFLAREVPQLRVLLLGTYRDVDAPHEAPLAETLGALAREPVTRLTLDGLGDADIAHLMSTTLGAAADGELVHVVRERTEGNPFFVTELTRLIHSEGQTRAGDAITAVRQRIPDRVRDVLARRLARLPEQTTTVLRVAAVAARAFDLDLIEAVTGLDDEDALDGVEAAVLAGLVAEDEQTAGRYRFTHTLIRDTVYGRLTRARRVRLHARVGAALAGLHRPGDQQHVLQIAHHAWIAVPVTGAAAAVPHLLPAADHAMAVLAYEEAERQLRRALDLLETMPRSAQRTRRELAARVQLGNLLGQLGSPASPDAAAEFARAADLATEAADDPAALPALAGVHAGHLMRGDNARAQVLAETILDGADRSGDPSARLAGHFLLGHTLLFHGDLGPARSHLEEAARLARAISDADRLPGTPLAVTADSLLEIVLVLMGEADDADRIARDAAREIDRTTHPYQKAASMAIGVYAALHRRDPDLLRRRAEATAALSERWGYRMLAANATAPLGWIQAIEGDPAGGATRLRQALDRWGDSGSPATRPLLMGLLAEAEHLAGRPREALHVLDAALAQMDRTGQRHAEAELHRLRGQALLALTPPRTTEAETAFRTAIRVAHGQGARLLEHRATDSLHRMHARGPSHPSR